MKEHQKIKRYRIVPVTISLIIQIFFGAFLSHQYDMGIFFTVGHAISHGISPYGMFQSRAIFSNPSFIEELPGIGYPPPWALYLGLVYSVIYATTKNIFAYNLAIKIPSIISNIALAFLIKKIAIREGVSKKNTDKIFYFFLFNPFMIYISAIWGQFDSLNILTTIMALYVLCYGKIKFSSVLLALSISLKILPLVLIPLFIIFIKRNYSLKSNINFIILLISFLTIFCYVPFLIFNWNIGTILSNFDYHFKRADGFSIFNIFDLLYNQSSLPKGFELLGYIWILAIFLGYRKLLNKSLNSIMDLFRWSSVLFFILLLTRSWVSEQNVVMLIPLVMFASVYYLKNWHIIHFIWIITLLFAFFNTSPFQMFFLISNVPLEFIIKVSKSFRIQLIFMKFLTVISWQFLGWIYIKKIARA